MRVAAFILSVFVTVALTMGGTVVLVITAPSDIGFLFGAALIGVTILSVTPVLIGSFAAYWEIRTDPQGRKYFRRMLLIVGLLTLLAGGSIVAYAVLEGVPVWVPIVLLGVFLALDAVTTPIGRALYRWEQAHRPITQLWSPVSARVVRKKILIVAGVLIGTLLLFTLLSLPVSDTFPGLIYLAVSFSLMLAAFTCIIVALPLISTMREITRRDLTLTRTVTKAIFRRKPVELTGDAPQVAVRVASVLAVTLPFQLGYAVLFVSGLSVQWVRGVVLDEGGEFPRIALSMVVPLIILSLALLGVRIRRVRRYVRDHAELLENFEAPASDQRRYSF